MLGVPRGHPLEGMVRRHGRAVADADALHDRVQTFLDAHLGKYVIEPYPGGRILVRALIEEQPDPDWGIDVGEIVQALRSCLDYLVYQLAVDHHRQDPPPYETDIQFPILSPGKIFPHDKIKKWVGRDVADWLQSIQPQPGTDLMELENLAVLSNRDKHRRLAIVAAGIVRSSIDIIRSDDVLIDEITQPSRGVVVNGQVVTSFRLIQAGPNPQYHIKGDMPQDVVFGEGGPLAREGVVAVLNGIFPVVERVIDEAWAKFFGVYRIRWDFAARGGMARVPDIRQIELGCPHWSAENITEHECDLIHTGHPDHADYKEPKWAADAESY